MTLEEVHVLKCILTSIITKESGQKDDETGFWLKANIPKKCTPRPSLKAQYSVALTLYLEVIEPESGCTRRMKWVTEVTARNAHLQLVPGLASSFQLSLTYFPETYTANEHDYKS